MIDLLAQGGIILQIFLIVGAAAGLLVGFVTIFAKNKRKDLLEQFVEQMKKNAIIASIYPMAESAWKALGPMVKEKVEGKITETIAAYQTKGYDWIRSRFSDETIAAIGGEEMFKSYFDAAVSRFNVSQALAAQSDFLKNLLEGGGEETIIEIDIPDDPVEATGADTPVEEPEADVT